MTEPVSTGELQRWMHALEKRVGEILELQRAANGRVGKLEIDTAVLKEQCRTMSNELSDLQQNASAIAAGAASQAIHDTAPSQKRTSAMAAGWAGGVGGGLFALAKIVEMFWLK